MAGWAKRKRAHRSSRRAAAWARALPVPALPASPYLVQSGNIGFSDLWWEHKDFDELSRGAQEVKKHLVDFHTFEGLKFAENYLTLKVSVPF